MTHWADTSLIALPYLNGATRKTAVQTPNPY